MVSWSAAAQSPEELYQEYITQEMRVIMERFDEAEKNRRKQRRPAVPGELLRLPGPPLSDLPAEPCSSASTMASSL